MEKQTPLPLEKTPTTPAPTSAASANTAPAAARTTSSFWQMRKVGLLVAIVAMVVDLASKAAVLATVHKLPMVVVPSFFNFTFVWNRGVSFSFLSNTSAPLHVAGYTIPADMYLPAGLSLFALGAVMLFTFLLKHEKTRCGQTGMGLIIGGAAGNMVDRLYNGAVVDFLHVYYNNWHFPAFNIADSAITVGVCLLLWDGLRHNGASKNEKEEA